MGPAYWIPATWVPALLVTHAITFVVLWKHWPVAAADPTSVGLPAADGTAAGHPNHVFKD